MGIVHKKLGQSGGFAWAGVRVEPYRGGGATEGSCRTVLIGPDEGAPHFAIRYFEIPPKGQSSFEQHAHDHGIVILRGRARVLLGSEVQEVAPGDAIYIAPNEPHQFETIGDEPLGFLCVIPSKDLLERLARAEEKAARGA